MNGLTFVPLLNGGLGNQLFQLAICLEMTRRHGGRVALDFGLPWTAGSGEKPETYAYSVYDRYDRLHPGAPRTILTQAEPPPSAFAPGTYQLEGYWQDPDQLWGDRDWIRDQVRWWPEVIVRRPALSAHIRGGDYLSLRKIYPEVPAEHYLSHLRRLAGSGDFRTLELSSDDPGYASELLATPHLGPVKQRSLFELASSSAIVLSNSTWAWWAAFLGEVPTVVMPPKWLNVPHPFNPP